MFVHVSMGGYALDLERKLNLHEGSELSASAYAYRVFALLSSHAVLENHESC